MADVIRRAAISRSYSQDLRIRLVGYVEKGASRRAAAKVFGVSPSIAVKWLQRWRRTKSVAPSPVRGHRRAVLESHAAWLLDLIKQNADITLAEIKAKLAGRGVAASLSTIWSFYDRRGVSFKKKPLRGRTGPSRRGRRARALAKRSKAA